MPPRKYLSSDAASLKSRESIDTLGGLGLLAIQIFRWALKPPYRATNFFSQLDFVGVHEALHAGMQRLCALRDWQPPAATPHVNVTAARPRGQEDPRLRARLREDPDSHGDWYLLGLALRDASLLLRRRRPAGLQLRPEPEPHPRDEPRHEPPRRLEGEDGHDERGDPDYQSNSRPIPECDLRILLQLDQPKGHHEVDGDVVSVHQHHR